MKKILSFTICVGLMHFYPVCFSQTTPRDKNRGAQSNHEVSRQVAPQSITELYQQLKTTATIAQKSDIYFWLSWKYCNILKMDSARFYCEKIKALSDASGYEPAMGKYYLVNGRLSFLIREFSECEINYNRAIEIFTRHNDILLLGLTHKFIALNYMGLYAGKLSDIRKHLLLSINYLSRLPASGDLAHTYQVLGVEFLETYEIDSAVFYLVAAYRCAEKTNSLRVLFNSNYFLGELYLSLDDLEKAYEHLHYALNVPPREIDKVMLRSCLGVYAICLIEKKDFLLADSAIKEYTEMNKMLGDDFGEIKLLHINGTYAFSKENYPAAVKYFSEAYSRLRESKGRPGFELVDIIFRLAQAEYKNGDYVNATRHLWDVVQVASEIQSGVYAMKSQFELAQSYKALGRIDSAFYCFSAYAHLKDSLLSLQKQRAVVELVAKYETEKKEQQIKLLQQETDLFELQLGFKMEQIEKQRILDVKKSQELALLTRQNEINRLTASEKTLAFENQQKETARSQKELALLSKEKELQAALAARESQRKNFAYIAIAGVLVFSGYAFLRYVQHKRLSKQLAASLVKLKQSQEQLIKTETEKEAENIRSSISRDIHDEVGATLSGVALFSEIAKKKMQEHNDADVREYLEHISVNSKEMVDRMSDIVWAINPENDSYSRIMSKLQAFALNLCAGKNIRLHMNIDRALINQHPEMTIRKNVYLFIKEAVNNAVKYSGAKNLFFSLKKQNESIVAEIIDDGMGFNTGAQTAGNGLNNMRIRAKELKGNFTLDSEPGKGTRMRLAFNFHPAGGQREAG